MIKCPHIFLYDVVSCWIVLPDNPSDGSVKAEYNFHTEPCGGVHLSLCIGNLPVFTTESCIQGAVCPVVMKFLDPRPWSKRIPADWEKGGVRICLGIPRLYRSNRMNCFGIFAMQYGFR